MRHEASSGYGVPTIHGRDILVGHQESSRHEIPRRRSEQEFQRIEPEWPALYEAEMPARYDSDISLWPESLYSRERDLRRQRELLVNARQANDQLREDGEIVVARRERRARQEQGMKGKEQREILARHEAEAERNRELLARYQLQERQNRESIAREQRKVKEMYEARLSQERQALARHEAQERRDRELLARYEARVRQEHEMRLLQRRHEGREDVQPVTTNRVPALQNRNRQNNGSSSRVDILSPSRHHE